jgi:hypothetical protein
MDSFRADNFSHTVANCAPTAERKFYRATSRIIKRGKKNGAILIPFVAAGFYFAPSSILYDAPYDPW